MTLINECVRCESLDTTQQHIDWQRDKVEIVYACENCGTDFVTTLADPIKREIDYA